MHRLLQRQLTRHLDGIDLASPPWAEFLEAVNRTYVEAETDRNLVEHAMEISSHELIQANAELRALIQVFPDLILHVDALGVVTASRGRAVRAFGPPKGGIVGHALRDLFQEPERPAFDAALDRARGSGEVVTVEHTSQDGAGVHEVRLSGLGEGGLVAIVRDVSAARRSEEMRLAKEGAEAASRAKSAFLANMSHELRTPLNAILGYSEMLEEEAPAEMRDDLQRIHRSGRHLLQVLNAMLDIARIEAGMCRVDVDAIDVHAFVADALTAVRASAEAKGLSIGATVALDVPTLHSDRSKLHQALQSVLVNAVKFTERGSVALAARPLAVEGRHGVVFEVEDTGIGIPAEQMPKLFQDFGQVDDSTTRRFGGAGLGLALCRRLCHLLGGSVWVDSVPGQGSTFSVWVPRHQPLPGQARPAAVPATRGGQP